MQADTRRVFLQRIAKAETEVAALREKLAEAVKHGAELTHWHRGEHDCHYDHHGYCQAHGLQEAVLDRNCPIGLAFQFFAANKEQTND